VAVHGAGEQGRPEMGEDHRYRAVRARHLEPRVALIGKATPTNLAYTALVWVVGLAAM
jgi:hypothetical protein